MRQVSGTVPLCRVWEGCWVQWEDRVLGHHGLSHDCQTSESYFLPGPLPTQGQAGSCCIVTTQNQPLRLVGCQNQVPPSKASREFMWRFKLQETLRRFQRRTRPPPHMHRVLLSFPAHSHTPPPLSSGIPGRELTGNSQGAVLSSQGLRSLSSGGSSSDLHEPKPRAHTLLPLLGAYPVCGLVSPWLPSLLKHHLP